MYIFYLLINLLTNNFISYSVNEILTIIIRKPASLKLQY